MRKVKLSRPGNSELRNLLGKIYMGVGQKDQALREYEEAVHLAPDRADFREDWQAIKKGSLEVEHSLQKH